MANECKLMSRVRGETRARDVLHSSGFAQVQDDHYGGNGRGKASPAQRVGGMFSCQRTADERRRYAQGYENARIMRGAYTAARARAYIPRSGMGFGGRDTSGDGFSGSLIGRRLPR